MSLSRKAQTSQGEIVYLVVWGFLNRHVWGARYTAASFICYSILKQCFVVDIDSKLQQLIQGHLARAKIQIQIEIPNIQSLK